MKVLYLECAMGAAGDMLMSALLELHQQPEDFIKRLNGLKIPKVEVTAEKAVKCGIIGTHVRVSINGEQEHEHMHHEHHHHHHAGMKDISDIIDGLNIDEKVRSDAKAVYEMIAEAESAAHGCAVEQIHFHEVGTMDAITDVVGVCMLINELAPEKIIASPVHVGSGHVHCAHGILPVPAPATAYILRGAPVYGGGIDGELCTPTGAALLKYFASEFASMPVMRISKIGYGMGTKDFAQANCLRAVLGDTEERTETIVELCCNVDDMTGEQIGFAMNVLLEAGAADVYTVPIGMKKNRPGVLFTCMCRENQREEMIGLMFKHTSTIGIREKISNRYTLSRKKTVLKTNFGDVCAKESSGWGVKRIKAEHDALAKLASEKGVPLLEIKPEQ